MLERSIGKRANALLQELGREATHAEIADGMDITEEEVAKTMSISQTHLSLDAPLTPGEDNKLLDYLPELRWRYGYFIVLGAIATICALLFVRFRRIGWL